MTLSKNSIESTALKPEKPNGRVNYDQICHDIVVALFYPAVLGAIIFNNFSLVFAEPKLILENYALILLGLAILIHFTVDYLYTVYIERYRALAMALDFIIIFLLFFSSQAIDVSAGDYEPKRISMAFCLCYMLYIVIDVGTIYKSHRFSKVIIQEVIALILFSLSYFYLPLGVHTLTILVMLSALSQFLLSPKPYKKHAKLVPVRDLPK